MTPADALAMYRRQINQHGETVQIVRGASTWSVKARAIDDSTRETSGSKHQHVRRFLIVAPDLIAAGFSAPFQERIDRLVFAGSTLVITTVDSTRRRVAGVLIAYEIEAAGG